MNLLLPVITQIAILILCDAKDTVFLNGNLGISSAFLSYYHTMASSAFTTGLNFMSYRSLQKLNQSIGSF